MAESQTVNAISAHESLVAGPASLALSALSLAAYLARMFFRRFLQAIP